MVNLTTLAPDIVVAMQDDVPPSHDALLALAVDPLASRKGQR